MTPPVVLVFRPVVLVFVLVFEFVFRPLPPEPPILPALNALLPKLLLNAAPPPFPFPFPFPPTLVVLIEIDPPGLGLGLGLGAEATRAVAVEEEVEVEVEVTSAAAVEMTSARPLNTNCLRKSRMLIKKTSRREDRDMPSGFVTPC